MNRTSRYIEVVEDDAGKTTTYHRHSNGGGLLGPGAQVDADSFIGATSYVEAGAHVGAACRIGHGSWIDRQAMLGDHVIIGDDVHVGRGTVLGSRVHVGSHSRIGIGALTGQQQASDPEILVVMDAGYDVTRLAWLLADLPVILAARIRSDRVFYAPAGERRGPTKGRPPRHGAKLVLRDPATHPAPACATEHELERYGTVQSVAFERMHPKFESGGGFKDHQGPPPLIEGTVVRVNVEHLRRKPRPQAPVAVGVETSSRRRTGNGSLVVDVPSPLRYRTHLPLLEAEPGMDPAPPREPAAADRWTWIVLAAHMLLRLVRPMAVECRLPWQQPTPPARLTPAQVRATYRRACQNTAHPANPPLASTAGPGRPKGSLNRNKPVIQPVGLAHYKG